MMTALDAAYQVLAAAETPLHSNDIAQRMLDQGLWVSHGKTPGATVDARIAVDIKANGEHSRFRRVGRSVFTVNAAAQPAPSPDELVLPPPTLPALAAPAASTLSFTDAAERVLDQFAKRQPMHYQEITKRALELGLIATAGQTPASTMYAVILTEIDRLAKRGEQPRFSKHGKGLVSLTRWAATEHSLSTRIEQHNRETRTQLRALLHTMKPADFEALVGRLLTALGFESVAVTPIAGDGGIDVRGTLVVGDVIRTRMAVQVKRWKKNVQTPVVQQVRGSLGAHEQGLIITTSDFSVGARSEAARPDATPVALMNGEQLVTLLIEHDIGVRRTRHDLIELGDSEEL